VFLASLEGRQVTVRYARPGDVLGIAVLVRGPAGRDILKRYRPEYAGEGAVICGAAATRPGRTGP